MTNLKVENMTKSFDGKKVVDGLSLEVEDKKLLGILGSSGCGKTTILRMIAGLEKPDSGSIKINCETVFDRHTDYAPYKRGISMVFQGLALWPHMDCFEHLYFMVEDWKITKQEKKQEVESYLTQFALTKHSSKYPHQLSGGEKQRLAIARALIPKPKILLLDEPLSNLDQIIRSDITEMFKKIKKEYGLTTIYVTHNFSDLKGIADDIAVLQEGKIIQKDTTKKILNKPKNEFVKKILGI
ncbi:MAG: ABC transporter ATP-binding protein [Candidatus Altiarchaeota archaeon]|nr:ABC transporter ATP-binding protein [Candidatus Altiarchaeota archaeon]